MPPPRAQLLAVLRDLRDAVAVDPARSPRGLPEPRAREIVGEACQAHGLSVAVWIDAIEADLELRGLLIAAVAEVLVQPPDPGPYDTISRESAAGQAEPHAFEHDAHLLGWDARWIGEPERDVRRLRSMILARTRA
jgi:hypothetical protein